MQVILHLFNWSEPKQQPDEQDVMYLLTSKYSMRVDVHRKIVEYATRCNDGASYDAVASEEPEEPSASKKAKLD